MKETKKILMYMRILALIILLPIIVNAGDYPGIQMDGRMVTCMQTGFALTNEKSTL
jgi:hypothetical protein